MDVSFKDMLGGDTSIEDMVSSDGTSFDEMLGVTKKAPTAPAILPLRLLADL